MSLVDTAIAKMQNLPPERQQEIIDFIDFLLSREPIKLQPDERLELPSSQEAVSVLEAAGDDERLEPVTSTQEAVSVFDAAGDLIGCVEGPRDLSTNQDYLEGYGT